ncbi:MAG: hypothetical protein IT320_21000 [Anaerolineae bacterium]|nr:hypothetical protein [Anaerolineae bacterium]
MFRTSSLRTIVLIWALWAIILIGFQSLVQNRYQPNRPDRALEWTANETARNSQRDKPYLLDPFMNDQVSWDSEFYLSIGTVGYDDPGVRVVETPGGDFSMNYAFFPLYPLTIRAVRAPLTLLGLTPIATSTLAGVIISLLGTLAGMIALYDITRDELEERGGVRTAFYLLIFPTSFFLAQVYAEGLFIGLAFSSLALLRRDKLLPAAILAALATWTRSIGIVLIIPLALSWLRLVDWRAFKLRRPLPTVALSAVLVLLPVIAYLIWQALLGQPFQQVETTWFGRNAFDFAKSWEGIQYAFDQLLHSSNNQMRVYYGIEFAAVIFAIVACLLVIRRYPTLAIFGLGALVIPLTSGAPQSLVRYVLVVPALYVVLSRWGKHEAFDRAWTVFSILVLAMLVTLFTFDMWVA